MNSDGFEKQMRSLEYFHSLRLLPGAWVVIRVDGRGFSQFTESRFEKPFDLDFHRMMVQTASALLEGLHGIYAYTESDEGNLMQTSRLAQQIQFIIEIDKLKRILRQTLLTDESRQENSAEHSWHLAMMAILLAEYAPSSDIDVLRVIKMLLVHDLVEIDAGDTFCYDVLSNQSKTAREAEAATRLFGLLPDEQGAELRDLWEEFEAQETINARFATALDRLQPLLHNQQTRGGTWRIHGISRDQVLRRMHPIKEGAPALWSFVEQVIEECVVTGYLSREQQLS